jgi:uncharacterized protein with FMN-binding domain
MSTTPWRGTLIFVGGIAAIAATAVTRFAGTDAIAAPHLATGSSTAGSTAAGTSGSASTTNGSSSTSSGPASTSKSSSTSGTVTVVGSTVQTPYGPLQLSVTFSGSTITNVQALQYPNWHGYSVQLNQYAIPQLNQQAVAANSANINGVSGATFTSQAYAQSLQAAIDQHG